MLPTLSSLLATLSESEMLKIVAPLTALIEAVLPVIITVVGSLGTIWCVVLGVKYARAEEPQEHEKAKNNLKNAIIGFLLIFILIVALNIALSFFSQWYGDYLRNGGYWD